LVKPPDRFCATIVPLAGFHKLDSAHCCRQAASKKYVASLKDRHLDRVFDARNSKIYDWKSSD